MFTAVWCLFIVMGAWTTLRRMPFATRKSTLKTLGLTLLMLGLATGVIVLTVRLVSGLSQAVQNITLAAVVISCTVGLILGISAVATPPGARLTTRLPPHVTAVTLYRARILPWVRVLATILGGCLVLMLVPGPVRYIAGSFAGIAAFTAVIMLPVAYVTALRADRAVTALQLDPWLHWHYSAEVWNAWSERLADLEVTASEVTMSPAARRWTIIMLIAFVGLYTAFVMEGTTLVRLGSGVIAGLFVFGITLLTRSVSPHAAQRRAARLRAAPPDNYFGHDGVLCNGEFCAWHAADSWLVSAAVEPGPPRYIELWFEKILPGASGGPQVTKIRKDVLIPADAPAADLAALQASLIAGCPNARINLA
jgi:hypothetical protein